MHLETTFCREVCAGKTNGLYNTTVLQFPFRPAESPDLSKRAHFQAVSYKTEETQQEPHWPQLMAANHVCTTRNAVIVVTLQQRPYQTNLLSGSMWPSPNFHVGPGLLLRPVHNLFGTGQREPEQLCANLHCAEKNGRRAGAYVSLLLLSLSKCLSIDLIQSNPKWFVLVLDCHFSHYTSTVPPASLLGFTQSDRLHSRSRL
jgi:hypothetical protein